MPVSSRDRDGILETMKDIRSQKQIEERIGLKLPGENLEGFLFPDTYQFPLGVSGEEIVKKMRDNFEKKFTPYRPALLKKGGAGAGLTPFQIVIMASLIEKEVRTYEDKELVSGILWKRLENGMPLQVDATITYITGKRTTNPEGVASRPYGVKIFARPRFPIPIFPPPPNFVFRFAKCAA